MLMQIIIISNMLVLSLCCCCCCVFLDVGRIKANVVCNWSTGTAEAHRMMEKKLNQATLHIINIQIVDSRGVSKTKKKP